MTSFNADILRSDPARIALGNSPEAIQEATRSPSKEAPACQAALAAHRTALMFQVLFTALVFLVSLAAAAALVFAIVTIIKDGVILSSAVTGVSGIMASGAALVLARRMRQAIEVARTALSDVGRCCGTDVKQEIESA